MSPVSSAELNAFHEITRPEKQFKALIFLWALSFVVALAVVVAIPVLRFRSVEYVGNPIFFALTVGTLGGLLYTSLFLLNGVRDNSFFTDIIIGSKVGSATGMAALYLFGGVQDAFMKRLLGQGALVDFGMLAATVVLALRVYRFQTGAGFVSDLPRPTAPDGDAHLHPLEKALRTWALVLLLAYVAATGMLVWLQFRGLGDWSRVGNPFLVANGFGALAMLIGGARFLVWDVRRRFFMADALVGIQLLVAVALSGAALRGWTGPYSAAALWVVWPLTVLTILLRYAAQRSIYAGGFFSPPQFRAFEAFAEVIIEGPREVVSAEAVAMNVDRYLASVASRRTLGVLAALLYVSVFEPLWRLRLPLSRMGYLERRRFVDRTFRLGFGRHRSMSRIKQLALLGYYTDPRCYDQVGFVPFWERARYREWQQAGGSVAPKPAPEKVLAAVREREHHCHVCVIGSGAGGAVVAARLSEKFGPGVTILESGAYVGTHEFTHSEPGMLARLYKDGGLEVSMDLKMFVLQGSCVGGSTVHNNGICFELPTAVLQEWKSLGAPLDAAEVAASQRRIRQRLHISRLDPKLAGPGSLLFEKGARELIRQKRDRGRIRKGPEWFELNFDGCLGCGYCTSGCRYGKKMSMLDTFIPDAEQRGARVIANCKAIQLDLRDGEVTGVRCRLDGTQDFYVRANYFVISCGAIASSVLLQHSGVKGPVGERLSFNVGTIISAEFPSVVNGFDGVQMCGYVEGDGYMLETLFNPPAAYAMTMPGWFLDHFENMQRYAYYANGGVMVPSTPTGRVRASRLPFVGELLPNFAYSLEDDAATFKRIRDGIALMAEIYLAAGATRVIPAAYTDLEVRGDADIPKICETIVTPDDLYFGSAHPQGGNAINEDPRKGVITPEFKVHGLCNCYVADASVFPSGVRVNPQLSIMSVADYAAGKMLQRMSAP